ncbi:MAG: flagellar biosynthetic protein FliR [Planctomycetes bacterium]|nr:flagellar biosynthetic protein FliR [Planctomycetota bacterium]
MQFGLLFPFAVSLLLHVVRVGAFFAVVPIFGRQRDSMSLRVVLALSFGAIFWWVGDQSVAVPSNLLELAVMAIRESIIGFALGYCIATILAMMVIAGEVISTEMGFSMARSINPESGHSATVISQLLQVLGMLLVFSLDLHHEALRIVHQTFAACPVGEPFAIESIWAGIQDLVASTIHLGLQLAMPIIGLMLLLSTGTVLIGRAVPSINMMEFAFGLRVLLALGVIGFYIVESMPFIVASFQGMFERTWGIFEG